MVALENCDPNLSEWLCYVANTCGYISNVIWFIVLLPQLVKNYRRKSTLGLSLIWATMNFYASFFNLFFIFAIQVPLFTKISGIYMPILEIIMLFQFVLYSQNNRRLKFILTPIYLAFIVIIIVIERLYAFGEGTPFYLVWISITLWSIETYFQLMLNMQRKSVDGQSYISLLLSFVGKTTDIIMQFSLLMPKEYLYMTYFSSSFAYINLIQLLLYTRRRWYTLPVVALLSILLGCFVVTLVLRTSLVSLICPVVIVISILIGKFKIDRDLKKATNQDLLKGYPADDEFK